MKYFTIILAILFSLSGIAIAQQTATATQTDTTKNVQLAMQTATSWLTLIDAGEYGKSWDAAANFFQNAITKEKWEKALNTVLPPLGKIKERKFVSSQYKTSLPGVPDGEYVILQYKSQFDNKADTNEVVSLMKEKDGKWYVAGYFIR